MKTFYVLPQRCLRSFFSGRSPAFGAHPLLTDDTLTQGKGKTQIETSYQYDSNNDDGMKTETEQTQGPADLRTARSSRCHPGDPLPVPAADAGGVTTSNDGIGDITLSLKWRFYGEKEKGLQFAIKPSVTFPTGDEAKGSGIRPGGLWHHASSPPLSGRSGA